MRLVVLEILLVGCTPAVPPSEPAALLLPIPPPAVAVVQTEPVQLEPEVAAGGCDIHGTTLALASDAVELCGAYKRACFGVLTDSRPTRWQTGDAKIQSLHVAAGATPPARLVVALNGIVVMGVVDASVLSPHPTDAVLVDGFFVPASAWLTILKAGDEVATLSIAPQRQLETVSPLVVDMPCNWLSNDVPVLSSDDVARSLNLGQQVDTLVAPRGRSMALRATAGGPVVATVDTEGQPAPVYGVSGARVRILLSVGGDYVLGWVDRSGLLKHAYMGSRTVGAPYVGVREPASGLRCNDDVQILVRVKGDTVHAATILAGTAFDPGNPPGVLRSVGVLLNDGVKAIIKPEQLKDCHD